MIRNTIKIINRNNSNLNSSSILGLTNKQSNFKRFNSSLNSNQITSNNVASPISASSTTTTTTILPLLNQNIILENKNNEINNNNTTFKTTTNTNPATTASTTLNNNNSPGKLDLDTSKLYVSKSTSELFFTFMILKVCSYSFISDNSQLFINLFEKIGLSKPMNLIIKYSFFKQFCAGETIKETEIFSEKLNKLGIGTILDYSVEELAGGGEGYDSVADVICKTVEVAAKNPNYSFSCVKYTGLLSPSLLEKLNQIVSSLSIDVDRLPADSFKVSPLEFYSKYGADKLSTQEMNEMKQFFKRTDNIFSLCNKYGVPILVDAEQSYYQVAIHHITMAYSAMYNKDKPILYNTYQMYLANGMNVLEQHLALSNKHSFKLGVKIVRGAYMVTESERAERLHYDNPILPTINDTHNSYNGALDYLLRIIQQSPLNSIGLMIASHNEDSINLGTQLIAKYNIDPTNPNIQFGQLFGMADFLSFNLVAQKQRIFKYVPFGPVKEVLPYLIRRMHENKGFIGSNSDKELFYLKKEIKRRLF